MHLHGEGLRAERSVIPATISQHGKGWRSQIVLSFHLLRQSHWGRPSLELALADVPLEVGSRQLREMGELVTRQALL